MADEPQVAAETQPPTDGGQIVEQSSGQQSPGDLESYLTEFQRLTADNNAEQATADDTDLNQLDHLSPLVAEHGKTIEAQQQTISELQNQLGGVNHYLREWNDKVEINRLVDSMQKEVVSRGYTLSKQAVHRWLMSEGVLNDALRSSFDHRGDGPDQGADYAYSLRKAEKALLEHARQEHARAQGEFHRQENLAVIADALKRGSVSAPPPEPAPRYGDMNDKEFEAAVQKTLGRK